MKIDSNIILKNLQTRYATKVFDKSKKIPESLWSEIEDMLVLTPSSYGLQPWKFVLVKNQTMLEKLKTASRNQSQVTDCSHYLVFLSKSKIDGEYVNKHLNRMCEVRGVERKSLDMYYSVIEGDIINGLRSKTIDQWAAKQAYISLGSILTCVSFLGVDACPMEGIDFEGYDKIIGVKDEYKTSFACAFGYRSVTDKYSDAKKVRFKKTDVVSRIE